MNRTRVLNTFLDLVTIDSPSQRESSVAHYCAQQLKRIGFTVDFDESQHETESDTPQIIAHLAGTAPGHIAFSAHMDCVSPCIGVHPIIENGVIHSDGSTVLGGDDKSGIAEILEGVESVKESGRAYPDITVLFSVCEELSVAGAPHYPDDLFTEETPCFVFDSDGSAGTICIAAPYHYVYTATFHGQAAHAGVEPEKGRNAIVMAAHAIERMPNGRQGETTTCNVGIIDGGSATNVVPEDATVRGECRSVDADEAICLKDQISAALTTGAQTFGGTVDIKWTLSYPGFLYAEDDPTIDMVKQAARAIGLKPVCKATAGGSDANVLGTKGAKPILMGSGMTHFHSLDESLNVSDLEGCARLIEEIAATVGN
ncbi:MAG: M20/M25/M40 family metallo-hydrolase [Eggerthellaceae bacterium]|jgi:tripeptide aminopeptidase|nr:M20/M25/M40 family metallo-hydrolase [Eggerthellaceae bacterium]